MSAVLERHHGQLGPAVAALPVRDYRRGRASGSGSRFIGPFDEREINFPREEKEEREKILGRNEIQNVGRFWGVLLEAHRADNVHSTSLLLPL